MKLEVGKIYINRIVSHIDESIIVKITEVFDNNLKNPNHIIVANGVVVLPNEYWQVSIGEIVSIFKDEILIEL